MRDGEHFAAGLLLGRRHPFPQLDRVVAAQRRQRGERLDQAGLRAVAAEDDVAMQVVAARIRRPLVADERGESAGLVVRLGGLDGLLPGVSIGRGPRRGESLRHLVLAEAGDDVDRRLGPFAALDLVVPLASLRRGQQLRFAAHQLREEPHAVRVIGDDQEVERPRQLDRLAAVRSDLLAASEAVGILGRQAGAERAGIHREGGVQVRVAEERQRREIAPCVGRIVGLRREYLVELALVRRPDVRLLRRGRMRPDAPGDDGHPGQPGGC